LLVARLRDRVTRHRVDGGPDAQRVGEDDRRFDRAEFSDLRRSRQLAKCVADEHRTGDLVLKDVAAVRNDRRDAGADQLTLDNRGVADAHAFDVGDRVERSGREYAGATPRSRALGLADWARSGAIAIAQNAT